jgi:hypothetical protein
MNQDYPIYDGIAPSWADFKGLVKGFESPVLETKDIKAINTSATLEIGEQRAPGGRIIRTTTGQVSQEASITLYHSGWTNLLRTLGPKMLTRGNRRIYGLIHLDLQFFWTPPGSVEIFQTEILGCRITGRTLASAEGTDATELEIPLHPKEVIDVIDGERYVLL